MDIQQQIDGQLAKIDAAKAVRNVGAEFAPSSAVIAGTIFHKPTVSHFWLFARMGDMPVKHPMDRGVAVAYALAFQPEAVRNRLFAEVDDGSLVANMIKSWNYLQAVVEGVWGTMQTIVNLGVNSIILDFYLLKTTVEGVWGALLTIGQIAVTGVFAIVAQLMANIIDTVTNSVNTIIDALNRISGLEIKPIVSTEVMDKLKANAAEFGKQNIQATDRLASGQDFKDAAANNKPAIESFIFISAGELADSTWNWLPSLPVFLGRNGALTQECPQDTRFVQQIGFPCGESKLMIRSGQPILSI